jgi:hypothetical protein
VMAEVAEMGVLLSVQADVRADERGAIDQIHFGNALVRLPGAPANPTASPPTSTRILQTALAFSSWPCFKCA